jgi:hypothetical protein
MTDDTPSRSWLLRTCEHVDSLLQERAAKNALRKIAPFWSETNGRGVINLTPSRTGHGANDNSGLGVAGDGN